MRLIMALSIMVYFILLIILVINLTDKSKIIKYSFCIFMITLILALFFVNEIVMDYLISIIIRYLYYPTFSSILATIIITVSIFLCNIFNDKKKDKDRIINYTFASFILVSYIIFMSLNVNINSVNSLYSDSSLICLRYISRTFIIWHIVNLSVKYYRQFFKRRRV